MIQAKGRYIFCGVIKRSKIPSVRIVWHVLADPSPPHNEAMNSVLGCGMPKEEDVAEWLNCQLINQPTGIAISMKGEL